MIQDIKNSVHKTIIILNYWITGKNLIYLFDDTSFT